MMITGVLVVLGVLVVCTVVGLVLRAREGRVRGTAAAEPVPGELRERLDPGSDVTLVQLSTTFCAPCGQARALLGDLSERTDGVAHVDIDVTDRADLARAVGVRRTPTTLAVDRRGVELFRMSGVPRRQAMLDALRTHLRSGSDGEDHPGSQSADGAPA